MSADESTPPRAPTTESDVTPATARPMTGRVRLPHLPSGRPQLPPALMATLRTDLGRLRSLRLRSMLVAVGIGCVPIVLVWTASGFDTTSAEIIRLFLAVLPVAMVVGWWLGWRMVRPVEQLRDAALARALDASPSSGFDLGRTDEFGALAMALDTLVSRLEHQNRANEAFVADLAHELKNPLAAIRVVGERMADGAAQGKPMDAQRAQRMARILDRSTTRLDALVTELLELARTEAGLRDEDWLPVDLAQLARGVVEAIAGDPRYEAVTFQVEAPLPVVVLGVSGRIETALRNLVDNAASFNVPGVTIPGENSDNGAEGLSGEKETSGRPPGAVRVEVYAEGARAVIRVCDAGPGIQPADLPRVFKRFFTTRSGSRKGTGLGLALVQAVAQAHRGEASVDSAPGVETCFTLRLWLAEQALD